MPWVCILGFLRMMTHRAIMSNPMYPADAIRRVSSWLARPQVEILIPSSRHADLLFGFIERLVRQAISSRMRFLPRSPLNIEPSSHRQIQTLPDSPSYVGLIPATVSKFAPWLAFAEPCCMFAISSELRGV